MAEAPEVEGEEQMDDLRVQLGIPTNDDDDDDGAASYGNEDIE